MTLAELESLARAAKLTTDEGIGLHNLHRLQELQAELSPERVLAMIAAVKAAKVMREDCDEYWSGNCMAVFDAALAELEEGK
jgi:hypothetical protein